MSGQSDFPEWRSFLGNTNEDTQTMFIRHVVKRSGEISDYDRNKIFTAIGKAIEAVEKRNNPDKAEMLTDAVEERLRLLMAGRHEHSIPAIEEIASISESLTCAESTSLNSLNAYILPSGALFT